MQGSEAPKGVDPYTDDVCPYCGSPCLIGAYEAHVQNCDAERFDLDMEAYP